MKKIIALVLIVLLLSGVAYCQENEQYFTDDQLNGHYVIKSQMGEPSKQDCGYYIFGVFDGLLKVKPDMPNLYPGYTRKDIVNAVVLYYRNNPTKRHRPVSEVVLSGCK